MADTTKRRIIVSARSIARVLPFASKEEGRYYLNGVSIEPHPAEGAILVATDGHRMGVLHDPTAIVPAGLKVILARDTRVVTAVRLAKDTMNLKPWVVIKTSDGGIGSAALVYAATADEATQEEEFPAAGDRQALIDGKFPDWRRVVPKPDDLGAGGSPTFRSSHLRDFQAAASLKADVPIRVFPNKNAAGPSVIRLSGIDNADFIGVLMPIRVEISEVLPSWLRVDPAPAAARSAAA